MAPAGNIVRMLDRTRAVHARAHEHAYECSMHGHGKVAQTETVITESMLAMMPKLYFHAAYAARSLSAGFLWACGSNYWQDIGKLLCMCWHSTLACLLACLLQC